MARWQYVINLSLGSWVLRCFGAATIVAGSQRLVETPDVDSVGSVNASRNVQIVLALGTASPRARFLGSLRLQKVEQQTSLLARRQRSVPHHRPWPTAPVSVPRYVSEDV